MITVRKLKTDEIPYVYDSWIKSWKGSPWAGCIPNHLATAAHRETIHALVNAGAVLRGAYRDDNDQEIIGWGCFDLTDRGEAVVHFLHWRDPESIPPLLAECQSRAGVEAVSKFYTHRTAVISAALSPLGYQHRPEIARRQKRNHGDK